MIEVRQSITFSKWLSELHDHNARLRIITRIRRMELGNQSDVKATGKGDLIMTLETTKWDVQDYIKTPEDRAAYLEAAFEEGDLAFITHALNDVARAIGMTDVAKAAGITREGLYKALSEKGDPKLSTLLGVAKALGVHLTVKQGNQAA